MKALRTLVVEDDAIIGGLLAETLEGLGHTVCAVERNVANAVAAASHWSPDLMIVDVGLGEASGIAAVKEILRSGFVPYVFVTGDKVKGMPLGPDAVLIQKPFRVSDLDQAIQRALTAAPAGQAFGDAKLQSDGEGDKVVGKIQNGASGLSDAVRDAEAMKSAGLLYSPGQRLLRA
jgi:two-component system, response regulator PdtaR